MLENAARQRERARAPIEPRAEGEPVNTRVTPQEQAGTAAPAPAGANIDAAKSFAALQKILL